MDKSLWKEITDWFSRKTKKSFWVIVSYALVMIFYTNSPKLWVREHSPDFLPEIVVDCILLCFICIVVIDVPIILIKYLRKRISRSSRNPA
ncbi:hypothetical protein Xekj_04340 [Xenorhabdus sp. KJ12.1]|nr:hypothetical protein Xekj_04340 [Xenorhabdus sp. KJ12.1]